MTSLHVQFDIPDWVIEGLQDGSLERIGGVVREKASKAVRLWLSETGDFSWEKAASALPQEIAELGVGGVAGVALQTTNLAVSVVGLSLILNRISRLETRLSQMDGTINRIGDDVQRLGQRQLLHALATLKAALKRVENARLVARDSTRTQLLTDSLARLQEGTAYFMEVLRALDRDGELFPRADEAIDCYRAWIAAGTGQYQAAASLDEGALAESLVRDFREQHQEWAKPLLGRLANVHELMRHLDSCGPEQRGQLAAWSSEIRQVHLALRGHGLQLNCLREHGFRVEDLPLPQEDGDGKLAVIIAAAA
jgi:hypothetical protein